MDSSKDDSNSSISTLIKSTDKLNLKFEISNDETQKDQDNINDTISPDALRSRERRLKRRSSINFGSPLPSPKSCAERFYDFKFPLGYGATSTVYFGVNKRTKQKVAIKVIDKKFIINKNIGTEISILKKADHPNIVKLIDVFITENNLQIIMELCDGYELFDEILSRKVFSESDARIIIREIVDAIGYLHDNCIIHGDLKPENVIVKVLDDDTFDVKIVDFGLSCACDSQHMASVTGTLGYKAPEVFDKKMSRQSDMWSVGVIAYILCCGFPPFFSDPNITDDILLNTPFWVLFNQETDDLFKQIKTANYSFPNPFWRSISECGKDFIRSLLVVDQEERMTAKQALNHPWLHCDIHYRVLFNSTSPVTEKDYTWMSMIKNEIEERFKYNRSIQQQPLTGV